MRRQTVGKHRETNIHVEGLWELQKTLTKMGKDANDHVREASWEIADDFLHWVRNAAEPGAESLAANLIRVYRDRVPKVGFPPMKKVPIEGRASRDQPVMSEFFYGVEFGGPSFEGMRNRGHRFREHTGTRGYFFYPTLRSHGEDMAEQWFDMIEDVMDKDWRQGAQAAVAGTF